MRLPWTTFVVVALAAFLSASCAATMRQVAPVATPAGVHFMLIRPEARSVALAATFNQWSTSAHPLVRDPRGGWTLVVALPPGDHLFMYVVDGMQWISPPMAEDYMDDGFGAKNGVVIVRPSDR